MRKLAIVAAAFLLAACQSPPAKVGDVTPSTPAPAPSAPPNPLQQLSAFTLSDLQAASADAHANNDQTAWQCYDFLIKVLPTLPSFTPGTPVGAVLAFQKLRDLQNGIGGVSTASKQLNLACAPLVIDTQTVINKLILLGAGGAATGGTVAPFLGPILSTIP